MFGQTGRTAVQWRVVVFVGTLLTVGACVQIAGIDDPHPKKTETDGGSMDPDGGSMDPDAGSPDAEPLDPEWANWPMPNPKGTTWPPLADYTPDTAKGVVTDNVTKLMWQHGMDTGLFDWSGAKGYCDDLVIDVYDDWRVPTAIELVSLVDFTIASPGPTIDATAFPGAAGDLHWSASPLEGSSDEAWVVNFNSGKTTTNNVTQPCRVRCVRP